MHTEECIVDVIRFTTLYWWCCKKAISQHMFWVQKIEVTEFQSLPM
nr:MAG TPA: hypothetical protein [Caudoviricetes sp.]